MARITKKINWKKWAFAAIAVIACTFIILITKGIGLPILPSIWEAITIGAIGAIGGGASVAAYKEPRHSVESPNDKILPEDVITPKSPRVRSFSEPKPPTNTPVEAATEVFGKTKFETKVILNEEQVKRLSLLFQSVPKSRNNSESQSPQLSPIRFDAD